MYLLASSSVHSWLSVSGGLVGSVGGCEVDKDTIGKAADAAKAVAETSDTALKLAGKFGSYFSGPLGIIAKMMDLELQFIAAKRGLRLSGKWNALLAARG